MILTNFRTILGTWGIFSSPGDSKVALMPSVCSKFHTAQVFERILSIYLKSSRDRLARIVILTNFRTILGTWGIFSSPEDSIVTPDGLGLQ